GGGMAKKSLVEVAQQFINEPTGKYPWETKTVTKSVATPMGVGLEMAGMPTLESDETKFVATRDIEIPDPSLIHYGEVAGYIAAISPVILTKNKDDNGKWKILDGRHRLAAWRAAGYKQVPVVFSTDEDYK
ncbi:MAG: ParB N-terminal domain-containing protein, partial [Sphaerochaeta sp.]|nr:ParB N-terminal domain-containing protein [Sphaerochaeta sp.]